MTTKKVVVTRLEHDGAEGYLHVPLKQWPKGKIGAKVRVTIEVVGD